MGKLLQVLRSIALVSITASLAIGGAIAWRAASRTNTVFGANSFVALPAASVSAAAGPVNFNVGFSSVVEPLLPTVVNISTSKVVKSPRNQLPFFNDPYFRQFFGDQFGGATAT
jgi:S1-C subfamily serine protease